MAEETESLVEGLLPSTADASDVMLSWRERISEKGARTAKLECRMDRVDTLGCISARVDTLGVEGTLEAFPSV